MSNALQDAATAGSEKWKNFFNTGDAAGCASCYEQNATMVATPFGTFTGRKAIEEFWKNLISEGYSDVTYIKPIIDQIDGNSAILRAEWSMNKARGVITKELWVVQDDGTALMREDHFEAQS